MHEALRWRNAIMEHPSAYDGDLSDREVFSTGMQSTDLQPRSVGLMMQVLILKHFAGARKYNPLEIEQLSLSTRYLNVNSSVNSKATRTSR